MYCIVCKADHHVPRTPEHCLVLGCSGLSYWFSEDDIWKTAVAYAAELSSQPNWRAGEFLAKMILAIEEKRNGQHAA